jgi:hypothetical protein
MRWPGTILCLVGMCLTAVNAYPLNLAFSVVGSSLWCIHGIRARDAALWVVEGTAVGIGIAGLVFYALHP